MKTFWGTLKSNKSFVLCFSLWVLNSSCLDPLLSLDHKGWEMNWQNTRKVSFLWVYRSILKSLSQDLVMDRIHCFAKKQSRVAIFWKAKGYWEQSQPRNFRPICWYPLAFKAYNSMHLRKLGFGSPFCYHT